MPLPKELIDEFAKATYDPHENKENTTFYGTARRESDGDFVMMDGATVLTPATYATSAVTGDRVMGVIKNHKAIITTNITNPSLTLGILRSVTGIIVEGYLTTNAERTKYNDQTRQGLTFSDSGIGAYGGSDKYWYVTKTGELFASYAEIHGRVVATEGYIGSSDSGFTIDQYGIYSGSKTGTTDGFITLTNSDFSRVIGGNGDPVSGLRFAIGGNFAVTREGNIIANNANISGKVTATLGKIGNFNLSGALYTGDKSTFASGASGVYLGSDGIALGQNSKFKVTSDGVLTAVSGTIGGWTIGASTNQLDGSLYYGSTIGTSGTVYLIPKGATASTSIAGRTGTDWVFTAGANYGVTRTGAIYAVSGKIGGFDIGTYTLQSTATVSGTSRTTGLQAPNSGTYAIAVGSTSASSWTDAPFKVTHAGVLTATGATITGVITANSGKIGDFTVTTAGSLYSGSHSAWNTAADGIFLSKDYLSIGSGGKFNVTKAGVLTASGATVSGKITATDGAIGPWSITPTAIYHTSSTFKASAGVYIGLDGISYGGAFYVDDSGTIATWQNGGLRIGGSGASDQRTNVYYDCVYVGNGTSFSELHRGSLKYKGYTIWDFDGDLTAAGAVTITGNASFNVEKVDRGLYRTSWGWLLRTTAPGSNEVATCLGNGTYDTRIYGKNIYKGGSSTAITSDRRIKKDFAPFDERYEEFFMRLRPTIYRMRDGSSGRIHSGFIAQDVEEALIDSSLTTEEFAGIVVSDVDPQMYSVERIGYDPFEGSSTQYFLRYEEFIALNTFMIQKLKKEVEELKALIQNGGE